MSDLTTDDGLKKLMKHKTVQLNDGRRAKKLQSAVKGSVGRQKSARGRQKKWQAKNGSLQEP